MQETFTITTPHISPRPHSPRTLVHPGPFDPVRIRSMQAARARHVWLRLQPGRTMFDALIEPLHATEDDGTLKARLSGVVADPEGRVHGGVFVAGFNPIGISFEVTLEEWLPFGAN